MSVGGKVVMVIAGVVLAVSFVACGGTYYCDEVIDGDTIYVMGLGKVRYIGIDCPEVGKPYYEQARSLNAQLVQGRSVQLELDVQERDKYGRLLAYVYADGEMVNARLLEEGLATLLTIPPNLRYVELFEDALRRAKEDNKGMWRYGR